MAAPQFDKFKQYFNRKKPSIQEIVREPTAGGIVFRRDEKGAIEILLIQDAKDRWTIPKGHIEEGETAQQTAKREIGEEAGLKEVDVLGWLGKIHFRYRRIDKLVLMTTQIYLVRAKGDTNAIKKRCNPSRSSSVISPIIPKSMKVILKSISEPGSPFETNMFPGCGSAWK